MTLRRLSSLALPLLLCASAALAHDAEDPASVGGEDVYGEQIRPILEQYCFGCHGAKRQRGGVRFDQVDPDMVAGPDAEVWRIARDLLNSGDMPPRRAPKPTDEERRTLVSWLNTSLEEAARANEEAPEAVLRRLNRAQYTNTLRELLGVEKEFGRVLPADGKSEMGFTNNGEVLLSSPLHLEYYQDIAREALEAAIVEGEKPAAMRYRVTLGEGIGVGHPGATTGGYQSVPLSPDDFVVDLLDADGTPLQGATEEEQEALDAIKRKITVGFRGSSQDRFHSVEEGVILYGALPHKEVAPGAWQGPSPNMKLEMQRVFPQEGAFELRVRASRGYLVRGRKELLVSLEDPSPRARLLPRASGAESDPRAAEPTSLGPWLQAGPIFTSTGDEAHATAWFPKDAPLDLEAPLSDGITRWTPVEGETDGSVQRYADRVGVVFLARVLEAPTARRMNVSLGSDDALFVYLNGEKVLDRDVRRGVSPNQDRLALELVAGRNELVLEIVNHGGGFGSYHDVLHDGATAGDAPFVLEAADEATVLRADGSLERENLRLEEGGVLPVDFPSESASTLVVDCEAGYYQFDLVHRVLSPDAMGSIRFEIGELKLDLRPDFREAPEDGFVVMPLGAGYVNEGLHELRLGGPFFVGYTHLVMTPLEPEHPLVVRLENQAAIDEAAERPALRAFIGTRTDDGMDYKTFDDPVEVDAALGEAVTYTFAGRLEDLPIPEPESGDDEILSGILVAGVWNDHLVKSRGDNGPPLLVESLEFEAPYHEVWPPRSHTDILFDSPLRNDEDAYTRAVLERFLARAFRRPATSSEVERYHGFWRAIRPDSATYEESVREVLIAVLCSPSFLFLAEPLVAPAEPELPQTALASRLSYFLWNAPPDERLRELAAEGRLRASLDEEVARLLDDARSQQFVRAFVSEWLRLDRLEGMTINPNEFPAFTRFVKRDLALETVHFVDHVLREDKSLFELVDSDFAMLNQNLAEFYGVEGVEGIAFRAVELPRELGRGGLMSQGSFLAGHSDGNEPHPIKRAVWVKEKLLGQPPLPPPPNVPDLDPTAPGTEELTLKEQIEQHRDNPSCYDCHASFDPYGIALEGYNAVGLVQAERKGKPVDASTVLPDGTEVDGAAGLKAYLLEEKRDEFAASVLKHLFAYALGRDLAFTDEPELRELQETVRSDGYRLRAAVQAVVSSPSFSLHP